MKKITIGVFVFSVIALLGIGVAAAFPFDRGKGAMNYPLSEAEQAEMQTFHDSLQNAIDHEDFDAWKNLMESQLTEENFNMMIENQKDMEAQRAEREAYCEENDCPKFDGNNTGMMPGIGKGFRGMHTPERGSISAE